MYNFLYFYPLSCSELKIGTWFDPVTGLLFAYSEGKQNFYLVVCY